MVRRYWLRLLIVMLPLLPVLGNVLLSPTPTHLSPGELSFQHSRLMQKCADCHTAPQQSTVEWLRSECAGDRPVQESRLCLNCHRLGEHALSPHGYDPHQLTAITANSTQANEATAAVKTSHDARNRLACATCHREHQGNRANLIDVKQSQCNTCHAGKTDRFDVGHPEFTSYPHERRTRLYFDHTSHYASHFANFRRIMPGGVAPQSCQACHRSDQSGTTMLLRNFEHVCSSCHSRQINDEDFPGVALLAYQQLDLATLREKGISIGDWPAPTVPATADNRLPPLMQLLLNADREFVDAFQKLADVDLRRLAGTTAEQLVAVEQSVWSMKRLLFEATQNDGTKLRQRLKHALGPDPSPAELAKFYAGLPSEVLNAARDKWFPNLKSELEQHLKGERIEPSISPARPPVSDNRSSITRLGNGWYLDDRDCSIRYRPRQHADALLQIWLELASRRGQPASGGAADIMAIQRKHRSSSIQRLFDALTEPTSPGACMKCHTVDRQADGSLHVNWFAFRPDPNQHLFTKFKHLPHTALVARENCLKCHRVNWRVDFFRQEFLHRDFSINVNPHSDNTSGFRSSKKADCVQCHSRQTSRDTCLTCHNYHVGEFRATDWSSIRDRYQSFSGAVSRQTMNANRQP